MKLLFLVCLLPLTAMAQFGGVEQPFFSAPASQSQSSITNDGALQLLWVDSDLTNGTVTSWVDRKQSWSLTRYNPSVGPTKSTNGLFFNGFNTKDYLLTNAFWDYATNQVLGLVLNPNKVPNSWSYNAFFETTNNVWKFYDQSMGGNGAAAIVDINDTFTSSVYYITNLQDIVIAYSNTTARIYTNGLFSKSITYGTGGLLRHAGRVIGGGLGVSQIYNYQGYINCVALFSNVSDPFPYATNWHNWRTNTYGGSP